MSVTAAAGFRAAGVAAGIKKSGALDLALVVNDGPLDIAAGVFTANRFKAAPVLWTEAAVRDGRLRAVLLNSGGANACTGAEGFADTHASAEQAALDLTSAGCETSPLDVAVCSTGLIGERLPIQALLAGIGHAVAGLGANGDEAARAIMTTDSVPKTAVVRAGGYSVGGMAKGAGMLAPALATMLAVITTDAVVDASLADSALRVAASLTFDRIDSDGCMSTNDTVLLLASGASGAAPDPASFADAVTEVCADLARQLIGDAEGATKEIAITVHSAASEDDALAAARAIARSNLLKCAIHGEDPNWGRMLSALGTTSAIFEPDRVDAAINGVPVCRGGAAGADRAEVDLSARQVRIDISLGAGSHEATIWTNDLTAAYVHENSAYSS